MLGQLKDAQQAGVISANVLNFSSADNTWLVYLSSAMPVVDVRASRFVAERAMILGTMAAPLPGNGEPARPIARGWALVVPTRDPSRLPLAASLVAWLVSPENEGAWTRAANLLPVHRSAFDHWYPADSYTEFIRQELERAIPAPPAYVTQIVGPALQKAVADVLRGEAQPAEAAAAAVASVGRGSK
jgi:ABC-type glycerol-3-phosphate transport system substrate-binding protein